LDNGPLIAGYHFMTQRCFSLPMPDWFEALKPIGNRAFHDSICAASRGDIPRKI
jgi:hypothetical protein